MAWSIVVFSDVDLDNNSHLSYFLSIVPSRTLLVEVISDRIDVIDESISCLADERNSLVRYLNDLK